MNPDNQAIMQAIMGVGAVQPNTTWNTGVFGGNDNATMGSMPNMQQPQQNNMQQPQTGNPVHMNTIQSFFSGPQSTFGNNVQTPSRHTPGRNDWNSGMSLGHQQILSNIGLGGQQNG